jgi:hypothetical protein
MTPVDELRKLNKLIRQFEVVYRSSGDPAQRDRVGVEIKKLKVYREKLEKFHQIDPNALPEEEVSDQMELRPFLWGMVEKDRQVVACKDREIYHVSLYLRFFERDFLSILSETRLKLDFKHSLERDSFYHRFESLRKRLEDFEEEAIRMSRSGEGLEADLKLRSFKKKRNLTIEADRFFRSLHGFSDELIKDLEQDGMKCLNGEEVIQFEKIEGRRYLEGVQVKDALKRLKDLSDEVVQYLNIPQFKVQE